MASTKNKHLTLDDRITILEELKKGTILVDISKKIHKDSTTISKEIKRNRYSKSPSRITSGCGTLCTNLRTCKIRNLCEGKCGPLLCKQCTSINCTKLCNSFIPFVCKQITRFPYVCHSCEKKQGCRMEHYYYDPKQADKDYHDTLVSARTGINLTEAEFKIIDDIIYDGVNKGQSIYAILQGHPELNISERTIYRYIERNYTKIINIDLRKKVTYKKRYKSKVRKDEVSIYRKGRTYADYINYLSANPNIRVSQLDLVIGKISDNQHLLTILFPIANFMLAFLIPDKKPESIESIFNFIQETLGIDNFKILFPAILTDRGTEFYHPEKIEFDKNGELRTHIFYCDSYSSYQKAPLERNHELIRYFLPQGTSFNNLTQDKVNLMLSHINSYPRKSKNDYCPYDIFQVIYGKEILDKLKITRLAPSDVVLKPTILK